jgi:hypothetical protein
MLCDCNGVGVVASYHGKNSLQQYCTTRTTLRTRAHHASDMVCKKKQSTDRIGSDRIGSDRIESLQLRLNSKRTPLLRFPVREIFKCFLFSDFYGALIVNIGLNSSLTTD